MDMDNHTDADSCLIFGFVLNGCIDGAVCILGVIGNLVAFFFLNRCKLDKVSILSLRCLSASDASLMSLHFITVVWPQMFYILHKEDEIYNIVTYLWVYGFCIAVMTRILGTWLTVMICHHRFIMVSKPLLARRLIDLFSVKIHISIAIAYSILIVIPQFFEYEVVWINGTAYQSPTDLAYEASYQNVYKIGIVVVVNKVLPVVVIFVETIAIVVLLTRQQKRRVATFPICAISDNARVKQQNMLKVTKTLSIIIGLFVVSNVPNIIAHIINLMLPPPSNCSDFWLRFTSVTNSIILANCAFNVFVYYPCHIVTKHAFLFCGSCCQDTENCHALNNGHQLSVATISEQTN